MKNRFYLVLLILISFMQYQYSQIVIDGMVIIDSPITINEDIFVIGQGHLLIQNTTVKMGQGKTIYVIQNATVEIDRSIVTASDTEWNGIFISKDIPSAGQPPIPGEPTVIAKNGSIISKAINGIKLENDGKIECSSGAQFRNNITGIRIENQSHLYSPTVELNDTKFADNLHGIFQFDDIGTITIEDCFFMNNDFGYRASSTHYFSIQDIESCFFYQNIYGIFYNGRNTLNVHNCTFFDNSKGILLFNELLRANITSSVFYEDLNGIEIIDAGSVNISDNNQFNYCTYGVNIPFLGWDINSKITIEESNYFSGCVVGIYQMSGSWTYPINVSNNTFEDNIFGYYTRGTNRFNVAENILISNDYNVVVVSSGEGRSQIVCNEFFEPISGIQIAHFNEGATFEQNYFNNTMWQDVLLNNSVIALDIGSEEEPALNYFSPNSGDVLLWGNNAPFTYWLPAQPINRTDPADMLGEFKEQAYTSSSNVCQGYSIPPDPIHADTLKVWIQNYCQLLASYDQSPDIEKLKQIRAEKQKLLRHLYYYFQNIGFGITFQQVESLLRDYCNRWFFQERLFYLYLSDRDYDKADSLLSAIELSLLDTPLNNPLDSLERLRKQSFVNIFSIGLPYLRDTARFDDPFSYGFTTGEISTLRLEAESLLPESGIAQSFYYLATGEMLDMLFVEYELKPRQAEEKEITNKMKWIVYPNPVSSHLSICFEGVHEGSVYVAIYDIRGSKRFGSQMQFLQGDCQSVDLTEFRNGIYTLSVYDTKGAILHTDKLIVQN